MWLFSKILRSFFSVSSFFFLVSSKAQQFGYRFVCQLYGFTAKFKWEFLSYLCRLQFCRFCDKMVDIADSVDISCSPLSLCCCWKFFKVDVPLLSQNLSLREKLRNYFCKRERERRSEDSGNLWESFRSRHLHSTDWRNEKNTGAARRSRGRASTSHTHTHTRTHTIHALFLSLSIANS